MRHFEIAILGGGSGAEAVCGAGLGGRSALVVEERRFGGECPFVACMPSKAMLFDAARQLAQRPGGAEGLALEAYRRAVARRDRVVEHLDDGQHRQELVNRGVETLRGRGRVVRPGVIEVGGEEFEVEDLVIATGSRPASPPIPGLDEVDAWTSDRLLTSSELPASAALLGGGPVGCELAQVLARFGCRTSILETKARLLPAEEEELGTAMAATLAADGVEILTDIEVARVSRAGGRGAVRVLLKGGRHLEVQVLLVAAGRDPSLDGLGLEQAYGMEPKAAKLDTDRNCRALGQRHLFAVGDVTGVAPFTHTASYQGQVVAANLRGEERTADYRAVPRVVYTDPPVAAVGLGRRAAQDRGIVATTATFPLRDTSRALAEGVEAGQVVLLADPSRQVLVGAAMAGPGADESIGWAALAIRAELPLSLLRDSIAPFPTYSEAYLAALAQLSG